MISLVFFSCTVSPLQLTLTNSTAEHLFEQWQDSEQGQWVMARCDDIVYRVAWSADYEDLVYCLEGKLSEEHAVEYVLRWK